MLKVYQLNRHFYNATDGLPAATRRDTGTHVQQAFSHAVGTRDIKFLCEAPVYTPTRQLCVTHIAPGRCTTLLNLFSECTDHFFNLIFYFFSHGKKTCWFHHGMASWLGKFNDALFLWSSLFFHKICTATWWVFPANLWGVAASAPSSFPNALSFYMTGSNSQPRVWG